MTDRSCPVCTSLVGGRPLAVVGGNRLRLCGTCGHGFLVTDVATDADALYGDHYAGYVADPLFQRAVSRLLREHVAQRLPATAQVLDVGCGNGEFLALAKELGYGVLGVDVSASAKKLCAQHGIEARVGDFRAPGVIAADETFDLVTFWDVIEHLDDPASFLRRACQVLKPGGLILIKTPKITHFTLRLSAMLPRVAGAMLQLPGHIQFFQPQGAASLLRASGFERPTWLSGRGMRSPSRKGGLKKRVKRAVVRNLHKIAQDGNLVVLAAKTDSAVAARQDA